MTGYTVHTGSTVKFASNWDQIFAGAAASKGTAKAEAAAEKSAGKSAKPAAKAATRKKK